MPRRSRREGQRGGLSWHTTGFLLPANFTNLFTDRYSSDHGATHKSGSECRTGRKGGKTGGKVYIFICGRCALRTDHACARRRTSYSNGVENLFRSRLRGGQGCRKYEREHLLGAPSFSPHPSRRRTTFAPFAGGF